MMACHRTPQGRFVLAQMTATVTATVAWRRHPRCLAKGGKVAAGGEGKKKKGKKKKKKGPTEKNQVPGALVVWVAFLTTPPWATPILDLASMPTNARPFLATNYKAKAVTELTLEDINHVLFTNTTPLQIRIKACW